MNTNGWVNKQMFGSDNLDQEVVAQAQASSQKNTQ